MPPELKVAVCEMTSVDDVKANLDQIEALLALVQSPRSYQLICFPENALAMRLDDRPLPLLHLTSEPFVKLARWSKQNHCALHLGSVPLDRDGQVYNASILIRPDGSVTTPYQKIHLFDVDVSSERRVRESDSFRHGKDPSVFEIDGWKIGSSICYDVRFSELYAKYAAAEVDVILIPSAFLVTTGQAHWDILLRARAIENQCYVLAAAQGGEHKSAGQWLDQKAVQLGNQQTSGVRQTYGHSMIVDPWGVKIAEVLTPRPVGSPDRVLTATLSRDRISEIRRQIPMKSHRRL